jgi:hypothetical protein
MAADEGGIEKSKLRNEWEPMRKGEWEKEGSQSTNDNE